MTTLDIGGEFVHVDGAMVELDALRIAEAINDYDESLRVYCVDPIRTGFSDAPFIIAQVCPDGIARKIFEAWKLDETVLQRIEAADTTRHDVQARVDWINAEARKQGKARYNERRLEVQDLATTVLKHKKSSFTYKDESTDETVTIYDDRPSERK